MFCCFLEILRIRISLALHSSLGCVSLAIVNGLVDTCCEVDLLAVCEVDVGLRVGILHQLLLRGFVVEVNQVVEHICHREPVVEKNILCIGPTSRQFHCQCKVINGIMLIALRVYNRLLDT